MIIAPQLSYTYNTILRMISIHNASVLTPPYHNTSFLRFMISRHKSYPPYPYFPLRVSHAKGYTRNPPGGSHSAASHTLSHRVGHRSVQIWIRGQRKCEQSCLNTHTSMFDNQDSIRISSILFSRVWSSCKCLNCNHQRV